ncbi:hypothetical protein MOO45_06565 [Bombilactobacillus folatiphilus]|uniref:DUF4767 domain-containing protein n=1 Tax=Bombilactobacillus folatiphilus TaxID=2923362 RepID=A0ABY4P864_9LACO|nr:hypothetical protein [Bombilactobacillus folatiphilus]UQS81852.1 hypothetical protein MOO45_06565 [Bombilactobacillus folatiphilus]
MSNTEPTAPINDGAQESVSTAATNFQDGVATTSDSSANNDQSTVTPVQDPQDATTQPSTGDVDTLATDQEPTNNALAQGTWGSSKWDYTKDGDDYVLTFHAGTLGTGGISKAEEFKDIPNYSNGGCKRIIKISFDKDVIANQDSSDLFSELRNLKK